MTQPVIFVGYSHRDEVEKNQLLAHLGELREAGLISTWSDEQINDDLNWKSAITQAKIAVLLVTANFLNSGFIRKTEVPELFRHQHEEGLIMLPVIAKACAWRAIGWLKPLNVWPEGGVPVWGNGGVNVDENLTAIADKITGSVEHCISQDKPTTSMVLTHNRQPTHTVPLSKGWQVLSIEDEPSWQNRLTRLLTEINCNVLVANNYDQAMEMISRFDLDLITIDLNLDKSTQYADGLELMPRIREMFGNQVPIIIITGTGGLEEQRRAFKEFNVFDFIPKAKLDFEEFQNIVIEAVQSPYATA